MISHLNAFQDEFQFTLIEDLDAVSLVKVVAEMKDHRIFALGLLFLHMI